VATEDARRLLKDTDLRIAAVYICPRCQAYHVSKTKGEDWVVLLEKEYS
jgi:ribosomal protein L37AE/L43A